MIDKKEDEFSTSTKAEASPDQAAAILIQSRQLLDSATAVVHSEIRASFSRLMEVLRSREKQLMRQVDVLRSQQLTRLQSQEAVLREQCLTELLKPELQVKIDLNEEKALCDAIQTFGKVDVNTENLVAIDATETSYSIPYKLEDYHDANHDHMSLYKSLSEYMDSEHVIRFGLTPRMNMDLFHVHNSNSCSLDDSKTPQSSDVTAKENSESLTAGNVIERRPSQVEHWLQQIKVETETEPSVSELEKHLGNNG